MDLEIEIPQYFLCPISLQIMKDPVTTITGISYDRESIELWLTTAIANRTEALCPATKQHLPRGSDLTPNHMLRKLIQGWCIVNAKNGIDRIPTPKGPLHRSLVHKLLREVRNPSNDVLSRVNALSRLVELANEGERNQKCMAEAGVAKAMILFFLRSFKESECKTLPLGIEEALRVLQLTWKWNPANEIMKVVEDNLEFIQSLLWILKNYTEFEYNIMIVTEALKVFKNMTEIATTSLLERILKHDFLNEIVNILHKNVSAHVKRGALRILINICSVGRNKTTIVDLGTVHVLIELELTHPDKKTTELVFCLLTHLCSCADGRQQLLRHAGGLAVVAKRLLRVSPVTDDRALWIIESIARSSATREVLKEMLRVSVVTKLCMVLQADCEGYLKKKSREILRLHSNDWSDSPCIPVYIFTRYAR